MLQAPKMTQKNTNKSSRNHSSSTATSSAWQRTSSTTPQRARADTGGSGLGHLRFSRGQGAGSDQRAHSNRTISSERGDGKLARSTTVMTIHSDSDENEERHAANSTRRKEAKLTRNTTVMTVHTDSEYEEENSQDLETFGAPSMILEEQLISDGLQFTRTGVNVSQNPGSESFGSVNDYLPLTRSTKRKSDRNPKATLNDGATVQGEILFVDPINMLSGEDLIDHGNVESMAVAVVGDDSDCDLSVSQIEQSHGGVSKNMFGSYLLAPMGFDDDEGGSATLFEEAAQIFAGVKEFDESDQLGLGENPHGVVLKNQRRDQERMLENKRRQGKLLLVSLLDNFCLLYEQSPERSRKLFYVICKTLSNMGIIDEEYLEEMSAVRSSYQRAFRSLVLSALTSIKQEQMVLESRRIMAPPSSPTDDGDGISPSSSGRYSSDSLRPKGIMPSAHLHTPPVAVPGFPAPTAMMRTLSFGDMFIGDPTRYNDDFVEICKLGKGGFASVFKARNKLDGIEYAVKKIRLRGGVKVRYEKIFREIRFLARLEHKNVIRYYSSWIEHADYPLSKREMQGGNGTGVLDTHDDLEDEYDDEYMEEEEYTNTTSMLDGSSVSKPFKRRNSTDYFSPHWEQHPSNLEDLSMNIVFGTEEEEDDGISFEDSRGLNNPDDDRESYTSSVSDSLALNNIEDMDSTRSVSSSLSDRRISQAITDDHDERGRISSVESVGVHEETSNWEVLDTSSSFKSRGSLSNSYSALSSSIEEIHRSLPSSNSMLTSRSFSQHYEALAPKGGVIGSGLGAHHGVSRPVGSQRQKLVSRELTLYIQMQLCQTTLQDYLVYRNERPVPISKPEELSKKPARIDRFGILSSTPGIPSQRTQSAPGSPLHQTRHKDLIDPAANRHIFRAIVEGVVYIHDQDMIHRDLKPSNIFLGVSPSLENQRAQQLRQEQPFYDPLQPHPLTTRRSDRSIQSLAPDLLVNDPFLQPLTKEQIQEELFMNIESMIPKIGDFGLVTDMDGGAMLDGDGPQTMDGSQGTGASDSTRPLLSRQSSSATTGSRSSRTRTTAVGTVTYASPEQLARPNLGYDQKADIYSLGIIFFELYHPFSTLMERHAVLRALRRGELPPEFVSRWPKEAAFVLWLMADDPRLRPTAREILEFDLVRKPHEEQVGTPPDASAESRTRNGNGLSSGNGNSPLTPSEKATSKASGGLKLDSQPLPDRNHLGLALSIGTGRIICGVCQTRCHCLPEAGNGDPITKTMDDLDQPHRSKDHHPSSPASSNHSRSELERRLKEESNKVKRLEMSMADLRAENKALLDRIEALERERATL